MVKLNTAAELVPLLVTLASVQGSHVVVVHTVIVAAAHVAHVSHFRSILASSRVTVVQSLSQKSISFQLNAAEVTEAQASHVSHCIHCSPCIHCSHWIP